MADDLRRGWQLHSHIGDPDLFLNIRDDDVSATVIQKRAV
jgi:hypothetical protein